MTTTASTIGSSRLDEDEARVNGARRLLIALGAALVDRPFDTTTHERLLRLLSGEDLRTVLASVQALRQRPEVQLRERIAELSGHGLRWPA